MKPYALSFMVIASLLWGGGNSRAADNSRLASAPLPPGPILAQLPDMNAWRIDFSYENGPSSAGKPAPGTEGFPRQMTVTTTKPLWHSEIETLEGKKVECWGKGDMCYFKQRADDIPNPIWKKDMPRLYYGQFLAGGFPDLDWLSPATYVGTEGLALVFRQAGEKGAEARIAKETRFPISWHSGMETRTFQLLPAPTSPLVLPLDVARRAADFERVQAVLNGGPPPPRGVPP